MAPRAVWQQAIEDEHGRRLRIGSEQQTALLLAEDPVGALYRLAARQGRRRLYVRCPESGQPMELRRYTAGLLPGELWIEGPALTLAVSFTRPHLSGVERASEAQATRSWVKRLQELQVQTAVLRILGQPAGVVRIADLPIPQADTAGYVKRSREANGQSRAQIAAIRAWRLEQIAWAERGGTSPDSASPKDEDPGVGRPEAGPPPEADDGSLF